MRPGADTRRRAGAGSVMLDPVDRRIIARLQDDLPIVPRPYAAVAGELDIAEGELIERLARLKADGIITRFGPFFDAEKMGGAFCLCAMSVPEARFDEVLIKVNAHPEVAHNYERDHKLNMWFVLATETRERIDEVADEIERDTGLAVLRFPKLREFFIGFRVAA